MDIPDTKQKYWLLQWCVWYVVQETQ